VRLILYGTDKFISHADFSYNISLIKTL